MDIYDLGTGRVQLLGLTIFCVLPELCSRDVIDRGSLARALRKALALGCLIPEEEDSQAWFRFVRVEAPWPCWPHFGMAHACNPFTQALLLTGLPQVPS